MRCISILLAFAGVCLTGCQGFDPVIDTLVAQYGPSNSAVYRPGFEYLGVNLNGRKIALALGSRKLSGNVTDEYWYSGQREMLHLRDGRIVEVAGMTQEIRYTSKDTPSWETVTQTNRPMVWSRVRDVNPGYHYGVTEFVITQRVTPTASELKAAGNSDTWVEEEIKSKKSDGTDWIYREQYALDRGRVVFSVQCIAPNLCFELKPLGVIVKL
jgi:hypothetical protein